MGVWKGPTTRDKDTLQIEFCELCGAMVGASDRVVGIEQGLRDVYLCPRHHLGQSLSFQDLGGTGQASYDPEPDEPHSGVNFFEE